MSNETDESGFGAFGFDPALKAALDARGFHTPTPIQCDAIPYILDGCDLIGLAQTGTGKTAAFALPLAQNVADDAADGGARRKGPRCAALILAPTRELAVQIHEDLEAFGGALKLSSAVILGGVSRGAQERALARGVDLVVGTPGRVLDLIKTGHLNLADCTDFVLDEADQMLDLGFIRDVRAIVARLPKDRQTLMFSATWPDSVAGLARDLLRDPVTIEAGRREEAPTPERIAQAVMFVGERVSRAEALKNVFDDPAVARAIVFTRTKRGANKVAEILQDAGVGAEAIHGNKSQNARQRALDAFKRGEARALVATDIAARGIDAPEVTHVINFDMPVTPETYVHRIGRTARAGRDGLAVSLCGPEEMSDLKAIERLIGFSITRAGAAPEPSRAAVRAAEAAAREKNAAKKSGRGRRSGGARGAAPRGDGAAARKTAGKAAKKRSGRPGAAA
ncbi:MAG: DEAD/DEAH box helicase [Pseudomonadota bacterium]